MPTFPECALAGAIALACVLGATMADAQRRRPPAPPSVIVDVDALGLIEAWWRQNPGLSGRSAARLARPSATLLFHCGPGDALYVWIDTAGQPSAQPGAGESFGCAVGEALFAVSGGGLACTRHGAPVPPFSPPSAVIGVDGPGGSHTLAGECIGPDGGVVPAFIGEGVAGAGQGRASGPCEGTGSSVTFRGQVTAQGC